jgi:hypothetical protein
MRRLVRRGAVFLLQLGLMLALPFWLLIRGTVWLYEGQGWPASLALLVMLGGVFLLMLVYVTMFYQSLVGARKLNRRQIKRKSYLVLALMLGFVGYSLFNLSAPHAKGEAVREEYTALHPLLRLSVGTFLLFNDDLLVTDMARSTHDYQAMGLKSLKNSLHYPQADGYVYAMDLRTRGHSELRNRLMAGYFWLMGFNILRHVGTADHLHVSLSVRGLPGVI